MLEESAEEFPFIEEHMGPMLEQSQSFMEDAAEDLGEGDVLPAGDTVFGSSLAAEPAKISGNFMNRGGQMTTKTLMASQSGRASRA